MVLGLKNGRPPFPDQNFRFPAPAKDIDPVFAVLPGPEGQGGKDGRQGDARAAHGLQIVPHRLLGNDGRVNENLLLVHLGRVMEIGLGDVIGHVAHEGVFHGLLQVFLGLQGQGEANHGEIAQGQAQKPGIVHPRPELGPHRLQSVGQGAARGQRILPPQFPFPTLPEGRAELVENQAILVQKQKEILRKETRDGGHQFSQLLISRASSSPPDLPSMPWEERS